MTDTLRLQARLSAPRANVYRALTDEAAVRTWLAEHARADVDKRVFEFWGASTPQGEPGRQEFLAAEPDSRLSFSWLLDDTRTTVDLLLHDGPEHTILTLTQDRLPTFDELMNPTGRRDGLHTMHTFWPLALARFAEYVEGRPLTPQADFRPQRAPRIDAEIQVAALPDAVFASLIEAEQIERWFGWAADVEPRVGGAVTLGLEATMTEFDQPHTFAYRDEHGAEVRWQLAELDGRTALTFTQTGYGAEELDDAAQHEAGWFAGLAELKRLHALGDGWAPLVTD